MGRKIPQPQKTADSEVDSHRQRGMLLVAALVVILAVYFALLPSGVVEQPAVPSLPSAAADPKDTKNDPSPGHPNDHRFPPFADSPYSWLPLSCPAQHSTGASGFDAWLEQHGATAPKISMAKFTNEYYRDGTAERVQMRGMAAVEEIAAGEQVASIPQELWLSTERARKASDFGVKLAAAAVPEAKVPPRSVE